MQSRKRQAKSKKKSKSKAEQTMIRAMQTTDEEDEQFDVTVGAQMVGSEAGPGQVLERRATVRDSEGDSMSGD